ncbi:MAG: adenylyltransferase/cytidyltransferase family protein [bacterium]|nr:adenylyltransferase/cytidyltransferase family protein [bacterium]
MCVTDKIKTVAEIGQLLSERSGKKVVLCHGEFDLLHFGHTRYFKAARKFGDLLVVTLTPDRFIAKGPGRPVFNENQRAEAIANLAFVDYVAINEWPTAIETLQTIKPDIYVKGSEYLGKVDVTGRLQAEKDLIESLGGKMEFTHEIIFSSSKLLNNNFDVFTKASKPFLSELAAKTKDTEILAALADLASKRVLVLGDLGLEEINLIRDIERAKLSERFVQPQGALLGLNFLAHFCERLDFLSVGSVDQQLVQPFMPTSVFADLIADERLSYPSSRRFIDADTGFRRLSLLDQKHAPLKIEQEAKVLERLERNLSDYDLVMVFEMGRGFLSQSIKEHLSAKAPFLALHLNVEDPAHLRECLNGYGKLDLMVAPQDQIGEALEQQLLSEPLWRNNADLLITEANGALHRQCATGLCELPPFVAQPASLLPIDWSSTVFALIAPLVQAQAPQDWQLLIGGAAAAMTRQAAKAPFKLEKMLFEKFVIALLNR